MIIHPLYTQFFAQQRNDLNWQNFNSSAEEIELGPKEADFSVDDRTWCQTCTKVALIVLKIILFPWGLFEVIRFATHRVLMTALYPAQSWIVKAAIPAFKTKNLDQRRVTEAKDLASKNYIVRHVCLKKDGTSYSGLLIGKPETMQSGNWVLQATGNGHPVEQATSSAEEYQKIGYNLLLVNGPGVGRSEGMATTQNLWKSQEVALSFLEQAICAKRIVAAGFSLGGAVIGDAIVKHECDQKKHDYLVIRQMSFDSVSNVGRKMMKTRAPCLYPFSRFLSRLGDVEIDSVANSRKMIQMNIQEAIIQAGTDETDFHHDQIIHHKATLGRRLHKEGITTLKSFYYVPNGSHDRHLHSMPFEETRLAIKDWEATL